MYSDGYGVVIYVCVRESHAHTRGRQSTAANGCLSLSPVAVCVLKLNGCVVPFGVGWRCFRGAHIQNGMRFSSDSVYHTCVCLFVRSFVRVRSASLCSNNVRREHCICSFPMGGVVGGCVSQLYGSMVCTSHASYIAHNLGLCVIYVKGGTQTCNLVSEFELYSCSMTIIQWLGGWVFFSRIRQHDCRENS